MTIRFFTLIIMIYLSAGLGLTQNYGTIIGSVTDKSNGMTLPGATVAVWTKDTIYTQTNENGRFKINTITGNYSVRVDMLGYNSFVAHNINVTSGNAQIIAAELVEQPLQLNEVVIDASKTVRATDMITPLAIQKLTAEEIKVNPGGNFDVSKVIQVLPGVAGGTTPNRNDIIVRGGGPSENVYYLDGIEIPVLNHFQTQGASGGAIGILNVSFINELQLTSSAFDSKYDNALASTFVIKQRNGNPERVSGNARLSGSEFAMMLEGPIAKKTTYMVSGRRSYLRYLFQLLDLPIRPDYYDFQYKVNHKINAKTELSFIGIGAIDNFKLEAPKNADAETEYIIRSNPLIKQWNYTFGMSLKRSITNGFYTIAISRNMFNNDVNRYENNTDASGNILFSLNANEAENKLRWDVNKFAGGWKITYGAGLQYASYEGKLFNTLTMPETSAPIIIENQSNINFLKMGAYVHAGKYFLAEKLLLSGGVRTDMNSFTAGSMNPLKTLSPRLSAAYHFNERWNVSASAGSYYKLPPYTALGFKDATGSLVNKNLNYINAIHYTAGIQYIPRTDFRLTTEVFYKDYSHYPVSQTTGVSFANIGTDYNAVGNDTYESSGKGRAYGIELFAQQKMKNNLFYLISATLYKSEFTNSEGVFHPSTWDYGYVLSTTFGYAFKKKWNVGAKYRLAGGQPYTPFDIEQSKKAYLLSGRGTYDYAHVNSKRLAPFSQLDLRIDKTYNFSKTSLNLFLDFQNVTLTKTPLAPRFTFKRNADNSGFETTDGKQLKNDGSNAIPLVLADKSANIVPAIGFIFEF